MRRVLALLLALASAPALGQGSSGNVPVPNGAVNISTLAGIDCNGAADSTAAFSAAVNANPAIYIPRNCAIVLDTVDLPARLAIAGDGPSSILRHRAGATGHMLAVRTAGSSLEMSGIVLDGNFQNNGGDNNQQWASLRLYQGGASAAQPTIVRLRQMSFINGGLQDVGAFYSDPAGPTYWYESDTWHGPGADGYLAGSFSGAVKAVLNNIVIVSTPPTAATAVGRAGYAFFAQGSGAANENSVTASNIQCFNVGVAASASLGCVDGYHSGGPFQVTNSASHNAYGRGFIAKTDTRGVVMTGNVVTNLKGNVNNPAGNIPSACFAIYAALVDQVGGDINISNNACYNSAWDGIIWTGSNFGTPTALTITGVIANNIVDGCGPGRRGVTVYDAKELKISGNIVKNCATPIYADGSGALPIGPLTITDNQFHGAGRPSFSAVALASKLWLENNWQETAYSGANLSLAPAAGVVTAWNPLILIDTAPGPQTLTTINNVPPGATVVVKLNSTANSLTIGTGGNIGISAPITLGGTNSQIALRSIAGTLYPVGVFARHLSPLGTTTGAITVKPADNSTANGNARGLNAFDGQGCDNVLATQVASGTNSSAFGCQNTASGIVSSAFGNLNTVSGQASFAHGSRGSDQGRYNYYFHGGTRLQADGDNQYGRAILVTRTTSTAPTTLTADQQPPGAANIVNLIDNIGYHVQIRVTARDRITRDFAAFVLTTAGVEGGAIVRGSGAATTALVGAPAFTVVAKSAGFAALAAPTIAADTTNGGIAVSVTAPGANPTDWQAVVSSNELQ